MLLKLFLAFTLIPIFELYLLIEVGTLIGPLNTVLLVIATGFLGAYLARLQGIQTIYRIQNSMSQGITPTEDLIDAVLIFSAGVLLITPGLLTDFAGFLILIPVTRFYIKRYLKEKISQWIQKQM